MICAVIKKIDRFGLPVSLNFEQKSVFQTQFGGIVTSILGLFFIVTVFFFGKEVIERSNPTTIQNDQYLRNTLTFIVNSKSFPFAFGLQNPDTWVHYIDERIYQVEVMLQIRQRVHNSDANSNETESILVNEKQLEVGICDIKNDIDISETQDYFTSINLTTLYCIKHQSSISNEQQIQIQGDFDSDIFSFISINIKQCQNQSLNNQTGQKQIICLPQEKINNYLQSTYFALYYVDYIVDPKDSLTPFKCNGRSVFTVTSNLYTKKLELYLKHVEVTTDYGWIMEDKKQFNNVQFSEFNDMLDLRQMTNFIQLRLRLVNRKNTYFRTYKKVQNVLAEVGGLLKTLMLIAYFLHRPYTKFQFCHQLLNQIFSFYEGSNDEQNRNIIDIKSRQTNINNSNCNNNNNNIEIPSPAIVSNQTNQLLEQHNKQQSINQQQNTNCPEKEQNSYEIESKDQKMNLFTNVLSSYAIDKQLQNNDIEQLRKLSNQCYNQKKRQRNSLNSVDDYFKIFKESSLSYNFFDFLTFICPCGKKKRLKKQHLNIAMNKVYEKLDIVYIMNKFIELDKLKKLLLNENQLKLFNFLPKPIINLEEEHFQIRNEQDNDSIIENKEHQQQQSSPLQRLSMFKQKNKNGYLQKNQKFSGNNQGGISQSSSNNSAFQWQLLNKEKSQLQMAMEAYTAYIEINKLQTVDRLNQKLIQMMDSEVKECFEMVSYKQQSKIQIRKDNQLNTPNQLQKALIKLVKTPKSSIDYSCEIKDDEHQNEINMVKEIEYTPSISKKFPLYGNQKFSQQNSEIFQIK